MATEEIWNEVKEGEVVKPEVGDTIEGQLLDVRAGENGKVYDIQTGDGRVVVFGTTILDRKMAGVAKDSQVRIERDKDKPSKTKGHSPMKMWKVFVRKDGG